MGEKKSTSYSIEDREYRIEEEVIRENRELIYSIYYGKRFIGKVTFEKEMFVDVDNEYNLDKVLIHVKEYINGWDEFKRVK